MEYRLDFNSIEKDFQPKNQQSSVIGLSHNTGVRIKIFPYNTKPSNKQGFKSILGEFSRLTSSRSMKDKLQAQSLIERVLDKVEFDLVDRTQFKDIIKQLFFNADGEIEVFHPIVYNYISLEQKEQKHIAKFLYDTLGAEKLRDLVTANYEQLPNNILLKLIFEALPYQEIEMTADKAQYKPVLPYVESVFQHDFKYLLEDNKLFIQHYEQLLKYYYYFYVSQLVIKLDKQFEADLSKPEPIYFTLDWETTSKSRTGYIQGWQQLDKKIIKMFSHANCLEFLNHCQNPEQPAYTYVDIKQCIDQMTEEQKEAFRDDLIFLLQFYTTRINDISWDSFTLSGGEDIIQIIIKFFQAIDFQFNNSSKRKKPYKEYSQTFKEFCLENFLKMRGPLGYSLNIKQEYLLFITRLCIGKEEKIRLKELFRQFERRGLFLDRDSQQRVIKLFEKLNLLEKKSDSGDAQYVKAIL